MLSESGVYREYSQSPVVVKQQDREKKSGGEKLKSVLRVCTVNLQTDCYERCPRP